MIDYSTLSVAVWGLGNHGGGLASLRYMISKNAANIVIIEAQDSTKVEERISTLETNTRKIQVLPQNRSALQSVDLVIKNPAIPRYHELIPYAKKLETDITLFYKETPIPSWIITGSKGKSSIATALHNIMSSTYPQDDIALAGNITYSPLNLLNREVLPHRLILELSSFQLGDWELVDEPPFKNIHTMILSNLMPDHQNYYRNMQSYVYDKLLAFTNLSKDSLAVLPYDHSYTNILLEHDNLIVSYFGNEITLPISQVVFHSRTKLDYRVQSIIHNDEGIFMTELEDPTLKCILTPSQIPKDIIPQNIAVVCAAVVFGDDNTIVLPKTVDKWHTAFKLAHRKEFLGVYKGRKFYNDSAATIPQAIQLALMNNAPIHLICGGTNKNLNPQDFLDAICPAKSIILLQGSFTELLIPLLIEAKINYEGPYDSLDQATASAIQISSKGEIIMLSPGCASFEMFLHEFDRGNKFKDIFNTLVSTVSTKA